MDQLGCCLALKDRATRIDRLTSAIESPVEPLLAMLVGLKDSVPLLL